MDNEKPKPGDIIKITEEGPWSGAVLAIVDCPDNLKDIYLKYFPDGIWGLYKNQAIWFKSPFYTFMFVKRNYNNQTPAEIEANLRTKYHETMRSALWD